MEIDTSACIPYTGETLKEEFIRIAQFFRRASPTWVIDVPKLADQGLALKIYALTEQGKSGDQKRERPYSYQSIETLKWDAWEAEKGKSMSQARREFLEIAKQLLTDINVDYTDP